MIRCASRMATTKSRVNLYPVGGDVHPSGTGFTLAVVLVNLCFKMVCLQECPLRTGCVACHTCKLDGVKIGITHGVRLESINSCGVPGGIQTSRITGLFARILMGVS